MEFNPGFDIIPTVNPMGFKYGADVFALWGRDLCCRSIG